MFSLYKFVRFLSQKLWGVLNPNLNPIRNAPVYIKWLVTTLLACLWSLAFGLYTAQFLYIGLNMLAHMAVISMVFVTWSTFRYFKRAYPDLEPNLGPNKCSELADSEAQAVIKIAD
ncbi:MAG: hypothetical protein RLZZ227_2159 [Pseudomonadota bacterium]|jgi:hypothetical protein